VVVRVGKRHRHECQGGKQERGSGLPSSFDALTSEADNQHGSHIRIPSEPKDGAPILFKSSCDDCLFGSIEILLRPSFLSGSLSSHKFKRSRVDGIYPERGYLDTIAIQLGMS
jgi:hypothetical protein